MIALFISFAVIALLLGAAWRTLRAKRGSEVTPTLAEHAAADAGRMGAVGLVGGHDATAAGAPTFLDDVSHELHPIDDQPHSAD